jgi:hypothetical protein
MAYAENPAAGNRWGSSRLSEDHLGAVRIASTTEVENMKKTEANPPPSRPLSAAARAGRSAVTNGKRLHVVPPGDTAWARRFRDVLAEIVSDLGGADLPISPSKSLLRMIRK